LNNSTEHHNTGEPGTEERTDLRVYLRLLISDWDDWDLSLEAMKGELQSISQAAWALFEKHFEPQDPHYQSRGPDENSGNCEARIPA
jgi:hypothetical protein